MQNQKTTIKSRIKSFKYAGNGLKLLFKEEHNARIHMVAAICFIITGFVFNLEATEWAAIIFAIGFVLVTEAINTAIENLADFISPQNNDKIKKIKDLSAAAVLISAITAMAIGFVIFAPKLYIHF